MSSSYFNQSLDGEPRLDISVTVRMTRQDLEYAVAHQLQSETMASTKDVNKSDLLRLAENFYAERANSDESLPEDIEKRYADRAGDLVEKFFPEERHDELRAEIG